MNHTTAKEIEIALANWFGFTTHLIIPNVSYGYLPYEADMLVLSDSNYVWEVEIKISRSDLLRDKKKRHQHDSIKIRKLWFAIPEKLSSCICHIPEKAGVLVIDFDGRVTENRKPTINSSAVCASDAQRFQLARLGAIRIWPLKHKLLTLSNDPITQSPNHQMPNA
jgi:hypothetical protein